MTSKMIWCSHGDKMIWHKLMAMTMRQYRMFMVPVMVHYMIKARILYHLW